MNDFNIYIMDFSNTLHIYSLVRRESLKIGNFISFSQKLISTFCIYWAAWKNKNTISKLKKN